MTSPKRYRGRCRHTKQWLFGFYIKEKDGRSFIVSDNDFIKWEVEEESVGQSLGIVNFEKKEIFEKDIVSIPIEVEGKLQYVDYLAKIIYEYDGFIAQPIVSMAEEQEFTYEECAIVGNILDTPHLLFRFN